ncbi:MAG TPA: transcriptional regulator [Microbacterium sp.]|nr:transcriptional regulator [Microbacterium sp.]
MPEPRARANGPLGADLSARQPRAIHSALTLLEAVAQLGAGATAREISEALGLPRATTYRLVNLLVQDGFLVRTPDLSGFALGAKVVHLASVAAPVRLPAAARDLLRAARERVRGGVHVVLYTDGRVSVVDPDPDFPFSDPVRLAREPDRFALGRLLLAERRTEAARSEQGGVVAVEADMRRFGVARQIEELIPGFGCLALPIRDAEGTLAAALGFSGPAHRVEEPTGVIRLLAPTAEQLAPLLT